MKKVKKMPGEPTLVRLVWDDAWSDTAQVTRKSDYYEAECLRVAVGVLKTINDREVVICRDWDLGNEAVGTCYHDCIRIPRGIVKSITVLALSHRLPLSSARSVSKSSSRRKTGTAK